jgi:hypothetical protein
MPEPMQAHYHLTERDYVRAAFLHVKPTPRRWVIITLCFLALTLWPGVLLGDWETAAWLLSGGAIIVLVRYFVVAPLQLRRDYQRHKTLRRETTVTLLDEAIRFESTIGNSLLTWDVILKWRHNADYVLIYIGPRQYLAVPGTVAAEGFDIERLKAELTRHVGSPV